MTKTHMKKLTLIASAVLVAALLASCADISQNPLAKAINPPADVTPISYPPVTFIVPHDPHIFANGQVAGLVPGGAGLRPTIGRTDYALQLRDITADSFVIHAYYSNGYVGSGVKYTIDYSKTDNGSYSTVTMKPVKRATYQQGLVGKFPVPGFNEALVHRYIEASSFWYKFEIDTKYDTASVYSSFRRLAPSANMGQGSTDPVTGKIISEWFVGNYRGVEYEYSLEVFPYRNGSKAVIGLGIPAVETAPNVVDYRVILNDIRKQLDGIANS
ncbi:hypothetical protein P3T22_003291 [Paraburkholderia sp. GAS348]